MKHSALLVIALVLCLGLAKSIRNGTECTNRPLSSERYKQLLLTRRTRGIIFPQKANLLLTLALTKIILGGIPSGLQYSFEYDFYHPLPDTIEAWRPNILLDRQPTKPTPPPMPAMTPPPGVTSPKRRLGHYGYYYKPAQPMHWTPLDINYNTIRRQNGFQQKFFSKSRRPLKNANSAQSMRKAFYTTPQRFDGFEATAPDLSYDNWSEYDPVTGAAQQDAEVYESWADVPSWKFNRGYRERRALFEQFDAIGKLFNFDMSACIKRAMCEFNARIMQSTRGKSGLLMEDLVHILLTIPEGIDGDEKYKPQHGKDRSFEDCARLYSVSCPYRVLDFLTNNVAIVK